MQTPLQISFRHLDYSSAVAVTIRKKVDQLEKIFPRITSIRVAVEPSHFKPRVHNLFHIRIDLKVPGRELVVHQDASSKDSHENLDVVIRDAFRTARRQLEDYVTSHFKNHHGEDHGEIDASDETRFVE